ncbi:MAG: HupE/UreJ family protein [Gallionella sp.]|jgi:urease accessory protein|nr:HupE/UreJ family protein [Gallionella sp.]
MIKLGTARLMVAMLLVAVSGTAFAHTGHSVSGWSAGWIHPFSGLDHMLAMLAVGLWAVQSKGRRVWLLPAAFMSALAAGAVVSMNWQHPVPALETGIALSVLAIGLLITLSVRLTVGISVGIAALFGVFHGYAHGLELPESANSFTYAIGFLSATALLHFSGILAGRLMREKYALLAKISGGAIAVVGIELLVLA